MSENKFSKFRIPPEFETLVRKLYFFSLRLEAVFINKLNCLFVIFVDIFFPDEDLRWVINTIFLQKGLSLCNIFSISFCMKPNLFIPVSNFSHRAGKESFNFSKWAICFSL